jgi:hypothetical protein
VLFINLLYMDDFINSGYSYIAHNIIIYLYFIRICNHVYTCIFTFALNSDNFYFMTWGEELCTNVDDIKYALQAHVVLYDYETLSSFIRQKHGVTTIEGNALGIVFEPDKEEIMPVPVAVRSKALVCGRSPAEIVGSNRAGGKNICLLWVLYVVR